MNYSKSVLSFLAVSALATAGHATTAPACNLGEMCNFPDGKGSIVYFNYEKPGNYVCALYTTNSSAKVSAILHMGSDAQFHPIIVTAGTPVEVPATLNAHKSLKDRRQDDSVKGELKFELDQNVDANITPSEVGVQCALVTVSHKLPMANSAQNS